MNRFCRNFLYIILVVVTATGFTINCFSQNQTVPGSADQKTNEFATVREWESYFIQKTNSGSKATPEEYVRAALKSYSEKNYILSAIWFDEARQANYSSPEMYSTIALIYRNLNDQNEELKAMNYYLLNYPDGKETGSMRERIFILISAGKNEDRINASWNALADSSRKKESLLNTYFLLQKGKNNKESCDTLAKSLLAANPKHIAALEWLGEKYYWMGENLYQQSLKKYQQNKTGLQHLTLTKEFENVSVDFNKSLNYFNNLWEISHNARYASFLANIHARFKNAQKAEYYRSFIK